MGYTHYFYTERHLPIAAFQRIADDINKIMPEFRKRKIKLSSGMTDHKPDNPIITEKEIIFNGVGQLSHETFALERDVAPEGVEQKNSLGMIFSFCKTARKPYDFAVCCALIIAKHHLGDQIRVSSDGDIDAEDEWVEPIKFIKTKFGYNDFIFSD